MADALKALDHVEGFSEQPETIPNTPRRLEILSPDLPCTTRRTSTQQKSMAETETREKTIVSEPSDTPITRNGRRRVAASLVRPKIETDMKEDNEGEEDMQNEYSVVPVHSVRRSARLSNRRIPKSIQEKESRRAEAVKIAVLSEEEAQDLEKEQSIEGTEISVLEEDKETELLISGEVLNDRSETFVGEESSVVDSRDTTPLESSLSEEICKPTIEETDTSVADDDVYVTEPLAAGVRGSGSLATEEKEKELHGLSEPEPLEDEEDGAALVPEYMLPGKICNSTTKESVAETSSSKGSNPSPNKESVVGDLIGNEQLESCKVDEGSEGDDKDTTFVVQNQEKKESGETVAVEGVTSDCRSIEDEICEIQPLETTCLNLCPRENPEMVGNKECNCGSPLAAIDEFVGEVIVEVLSEAEEISCLSTVITSEIQSLETRCLHLGFRENPRTVGCKEYDPSAGQLVLQLESVTNQLARVVFQLETDDSVSNQQQKMNDVPELENVADPVPTEVLAIEKHSIDESKESFDEIAENDTEINAGSCSEEGEDDHIAELGEKLKEGSDVAEDIVYSSSTKIGEEEKSCQESVFDVAVVFSDEDPIDFHFENEEPGTDINAGIDNDKSKNGVVSSFSFVEQEEKRSSQESDFNVAVIPTPTPKKSGNMKQTTPTQLMVFNDNKENTEEEERF
ncbi:uncharacterized protein LOC122662981 [Telopea speciosissima]|uniref:uncharacterized protein LOC122662981 n=1 Tax=Telopea speciosissima TaxID=54955 RepID=UPI001CC72883|nr:uncharacterized protein LOC122662981 [Telopea speciosissima]